MPRKTKEQKELDIKNSEDKDILKTTKKSSTSKSKKSTPAQQSKEVGTQKKNTKKATTTKKTTKKETKSVDKKSTTKTAKKRTTKTSKKTTTKKEKVQIVEYYDLPYRYNQTIVKVLAQTPTNLFVYWDISDSDRKHFENLYGSDFFNNTKPILIIHNDTLGYSFEVEINDFANSWYLNVADSKCDYRIELGRRPIFKTEKLNKDYIYVSMSNNIESPNDHVLFNKNQKNIYFKNVKTGVQTSKDISHIIKNMGKIYNIYDLYKAIYKDENIYNSNNNPSSHISSNSFN